MRRRVRGRGLGPGARRPRPAPLDEVAAACGERAISLVGDVSSADTNVAAVDLCEQRFGALHAVVANAGVNLARSIDDTTDADIERLFSVNVNALIYLAQAAHAALAQTSGSLVVMASKTGIVAQPDSPVYCATKGAAVLLSRALALDWAAEGIRVNAVCPGIVDTPMLAEFFSQLEIPSAPGRSPRPRSRSDGWPVPRSARRRRCSWPRRRLRSSPAWRCRSTAASPPSDAGLDDRHGPDHRAGRAADADRQAHEAELEHLVTCELFAVDHLDDEDAPLRQ